VTFLFLLILQTIIGRHPQHCDVLLYRKGAEFHLSRWVITLYGSMLGTFLTVPAQETLHGNEETAWGRSVVDHH